MSEENRIISPAEDGVLLSIKAVPAGSRTAIAGELGGRLKIKLSAAPQKGKANRCLIEYLAELFAVAEKNVLIIKGHAGPLKQVLIKGINVGQARAAIGKPVLSGLK